MTHIYFYHAESTKMQSILHYSGIYETVNKILSMEDFDIFLTSLAHGLAVNGNPKKEHLVIKSLSYLGEKE